MGQPKPQYRLQRRTTAPQQKGIAGPDHAPLITMYRSFPLLIPPFSYPYISFGKMCSFYRSVARLTSLLQHLAGVMTGARSDSRASAYKKTDWNTVERIGGPTTVSERVLVME